MKDKIGTRKKIMCTTREKQLNGAQLNKRKRKTRSLFKEAILNRMGASELQYIISL